MLDKKGNPVKICVTLIITGYVCFAHEQNCTCTCVQEHLATREAKDRKSKRMLPPKSRRNQSMILTPKAKAETVQPAEMQEF